MASEEWIVSIPGSQDVDEDSLIEALEDLNMEKPESIVFEIMYGGGISLSCPDKTYVDKFVDVLAEIGVNVGSDKNSWSSSLTR